MAPISSGCSLPPNITIFRVIESGPKFVRLVWAHQYLFKSSFKFNYELDWWRHDEVDGGTLPTKLILNNRAKTALISDLQPRSNYGSKLLIRNSCGRSHSLNLNFSTKSEVSMVPKVMYHEIFLIILILLIWMMILRHFVKKYNKMTFVSPHTAFIHGRRYSDQKTNKTSDVDSLRRGSEISKASVTNKFDLLEDVVCKWRSETVLANRMPVSNRDVSKVMDQTDISSNFSSEHCPKFSMSREKRRMSNATDDLRMLTLSKNNKHLKKHSTSSVRPSQSYPLFKRIGSGSMLNSPICPEIYYEDYDNINAPPCSPNLFACEDIVNEEELEKCRLLAKLSGPRDSSFGVLLPDGAMRRKVSEILLGKATIDIRRCSSISAYIRRPKAQKHALVRRQSLFQSFRKSFRRKRSSKSQGCSASGLHAVSNMPNRWFRNLTSVDRPDSQLLDTPPYRKRSKESTTKSEKCVKMQISTESYFTAADVLIHIEGEQ